MAASTNTTARWYRTLEAERRDEAAMLRREAETLPKRMLERAQKADEAAESYRLLALNAEQRGA